MRSVLPVDVVQWLQDTYTAEGRKIWRRAYRRASPERRAHMIQVARTVEGDT